MAPGPGPILRSAFPGGAWGGRSNDLSRPTGELASYDAAPGGLKAPGARSMHQSSLLPDYRAAAWRLASRPSGGEFLISTGDVPGEYRAAQEGAVVFDQTDRGLVAVLGSDASAFLHRLLANAVKNLAPGSGNSNLLLSAKGKILFAFDLSCAADGLELSLPAELAPALVTALDRYLFADKVTLVDRTESHAPLALMGPRARLLAEQVLGAPLPAADHAWIRMTWRDFPVHIVALDVAGSPGLRLDAGPAGAPILWRALRDGGVRPAGRAAFDILRVEAGAAEFGADIDDTLYPQEARLERAFALDKGCYIGQEVVAKIDTYGGLNKRLVALKISSDEPLPRGTRLVREDQGEWRDLGVVTSWAYSFVLDGGLALGYVKRRHQKAGTQFHALPPLPPKADSTRESGAPVAPLALDAGMDPRQYPSATIVTLPVRQGALPPTGEFE